MAESIWPTMPPCCCCQLAADNFDRADNTAIGAAWTETAGAWEIASHVLTTAADNALARHSTTHPDGTGWLSIVADLRGDDDDDELWLGITYANTKAWALRVKLGPCGSAGLWKLDGTWTELGKPRRLEIPADAWHTAELCLLDQTQDLLVWRLTTSAGTTAGGAEEVNGANWTGTDTGGPTAGLGTINTTTAAYFDNFKIRKTKRSPNDEDCPTCSTGCTISTDTFDRADSTTIGCPWTEATGAWEIASNALKVTTAGRIIDENARPDNRYAERISATITAQAGELAQLIGDYDGSTWLIAEVKIGSGGYLKLKTSAGTDLATFNKTTSAGTYSLCIDKTAAKFTDGTDSVSASYTRRDDTRAGLAASQANTTFDNYRRNLYGPDWPKTNCPDCTTPTPCLACAADSMADSYTVTLDSFPTSPTCCDDLNASFILDRERINPSGFLPCYFDPAFHLCQAYYCTQGTYPGYGPGCDNVEHFHLQLWFLYSATTDTYTVRLELYYTNGYVPCQIWAKHTWEKTGAGKYDCLNADEALPWKKSEGSKLPSKGGTCIPPTCWTTTPTAHLLAN